MWFVRLNQKLLSEKISLGLMFALIMADALITQFFAGGGYVREGNPLMARLVTDGQFIWLKLGGAALCALLLWLLARRFPRLASAAAFSVAVFYGLVLVWNASVIVNI